MATGSEMIRDPLLSRTLKLKVVPSFEYQSYPILVPVPVYPLSDGPISDAPMVGEFPTAGQSLLCSE